MRIFPRETFLSPFDIGKAPGDFHINPVSSVSSLNNTGAFHKDQTYQIKFTSEDSNIVFLSWNIIFPLVVKQQYDKSFEELRYLSRATLIWMCSSGQTTCPIRSLRNESRDGRTIWAWIWLWKGLRISFFWQKAPTWPQMYLTTKTKQNKKPNPTWGSLKINSLSFTFLFAKILCH